MTVHDSSGNLYRVFCQPTAFVAEARTWRLGRRISFMVRMTPLMVLAQAVIAGLICLVTAATGGGSDLTPWLSLMAISVLAGIAWGIVWNVAMGVAWGIVWGTARWVMGFVLLPMLPDLPDALVTAFQSGVPLGLAFGVGLGLAVGAARGAWWGLALGIGFGVLIGAEGRVVGLVATVSTFLVGYSGLYIVLVSFLLGYFRLEWYPVDVTATLWQRVAARRRPREARHLFQRSPIYWREPIWLPLIGLKGFLELLAEEDYHTAVEECLFVISQRPTQSRWARAALIEIMTKHLASFSSVREIAEAADELGRASADTVRLPSLPRDALNRLQGLARSAEQNLAAMLPHNRRRALENLRDSAGILVRDLGLGGGAGAGMWASVAATWGDIAVARLARMDEAGEATGYIHNPFVFGQPIEETDANLFVGRRGLVTEIEVSLLGATQKPALVLWGPRRMGKTSVLLQLPRLLGEEFASAFVDVQAMRVRESVTSFFASLTEAAAAALRRRGVEANALSRLDLATSPFSTFAQWMEQVEKQLGRDRYLLFCLDEFERLETSIREGKLPAELMDEIRHIIQHHRQIVLLFAGSHRPDEMSLNWPDTLISTKMIQVGYLSEDDVRQLVTQPVPDFPVQYSPGSVETILRLTRCQPYLVQAVCFELVNILNIAGRRDAREADVQEAVSLALDSTHLYFAELWASLKQREQALLHCLAKTEGAPDVAALAAAQRTSVDEVEADIQVLKRRGTVEDGPQGWRLQVPMLALWVSRQRPPGNTA